MKKIILAVLMFFAALNITFADEPGDVKAFFESYVNATNSYDKGIPNYYMPNAKIVRTVYKPDGTKQSVVIPFDRYLKEMKKSEAVAKATRYKNTYTNRSYSKVGNDYKISTIRIPRNDKSGLPAYFIVTKTSSGWKIKEENMGTTVQRFLTEK